MSKEERHKTQVHVAAIPTSWRLEGASEHNSQEMLELFVPRFWPGGSLLKMTGTRCVKAINKFRAHYDKLQGYKIEVLNSENFDGVCTVRVIGDGHLRDYHLQLVQVPIPKNTKQCTEEHEGSDSDSDLDLDGLE